MRTAIDGTSRDREPGVSVVIPTRNRPELTEAAIRSALLQGWERLEIIVVDDASADDTAARVARLAADDGRVRLLTLERNEGPSAARNRGVKAAHNEFIALLDSDNTFAPEKLRRQMPALLEAPAGTISFSAYTTLDGGRAQRIALHDWSAAPGAVIAELMLGCCVNTSTVIAPRDVLLAEPFRSDLVRCEDHELWLRLAAAGHRFIYCSEPLTQYRLHASSLSADAVSTAEASERVVVGFLRRSDLPADVAARRRLFRARWALNSAGAYLADDQPAKALAALSRAARAHPPAIRAGWLVMTASALLQLVSRRSRR